MEPTLESYCLGGDLYSIPFGNRDNSIRARIREAQMLVQQMFADGLIGVGSRILIIGAGATGISAAISAAELGLEAYIVDARDGLFKLQEGRTTRWIDPYQYDWPESHWLNDHFPTNPPHDFVPALSWKADWAANIAQDWKTQILMHPLCDQIRIYLNNDFENTGFADHHEFFKFYLEHPLLQNIAFDLFLSTKSIVAERVTLEDQEFIGFCFWEKDPFGLPRLSLPTERPLQVIVSGGGDGALQDYLRIVTEMKSAKDILLKILSRFPHDARSGLDFLSALDRLNALDLHLDPEKIHAACTGELQALFEKYGDEIRKACAEAVIFPIREPANYIYLVWTHRYFTRCYLLKRFLVLLISTYIEIEVGKSTLRPETTIQTIASFPKEPIAKNAWESFGKTHRLALVKSGKETTEDLSATVIIIRHRPIPYQPAPLEPDLDDSIHGESAS